MSTKHWKQIIGVGVAALAATIALGAGPAGAQTPLTTDSSRTITVTGNGTVTVEPDTAVLTLGVQANEATGAAAMDAVNADSNALTEALVAAGIAEEDIQTSGLSLWSTTGDDGVTVTGYVASLTVNVTVRDISAVGATIDAAQSAAGDGFTIGGVQFSFADPESVLQQARIDAVANARAIAEQYAAAAGVTLGDVVSIIDSPTYNPIVFGRAETAMADMSAAISPGTLDLSVQITVTYAIGGGAASGEPMVDEASALLVGLSEDEAEAVAAEQGWTIRVLRRDGQDLPMTMDYRPERVNVEVADGVVVSVMNIG